MQTSDRKTAIAAYKERKTMAGIYALRCTATGSVWVGKAENIATIRNRVWFALRNGHPNPALRRECEAHGVDSFVFEELERFKEEKLHYIVDKQLAEGTARWRAKLGAQPI